MCIGKEPLHFFSPSPHPIWSDFIIKSYQLCWLLYSFILRLFFMGPFFYFIVLFDLIFFSSSVWNNERMRNAGYLRRVGWKKEGGRGGKCFLFDLIFFFSLSLSSLSLPYLKPVEWEKRGAGSLHRLWAKHPGNAAFPVLASFSPPFQSFSSFRGILRLWIFLKGQL